MRTIRVKCPTCNEVLVIDPRSGKVEKHHPEVKQKEGGDFLKERLLSLDKEKERREAIVAEGREREKSQKDVHSKLFEEVLKKSKEGGPVERPLRDIDID